MPRKKKPTAREKIDLALIYIDDGALHTGVGLLREAAAMIEVIAVKRDAELEKLIGAGKGKKAATP